MSTKVLQISNWVFYPSVALSHHSLKKCSWAEGRTKDSISQRGLMEIQPSSHCSFQGHERNIKINLFLLSGKGWEGVPTHPKVLSSQVQQRQKTKINTYKGMKETTAHWDLWRVSLIVKFSSRSLKAPLLKRFPINPRVPRFLLFPLSWCREHRSNKTFLRRGSAWADIVQAMWNSDQQFNKKPNNYFFRTPSGRWRDCSFLCRSKGAPPKQYTSSHCLFSLCWPTAESSLGLRAGSSLPLTRGGALAYHDSEFE